MAAHVHPQGFAFSEAAKPSEFFGYQCLGIPKVVREWVIRGTRENWPPPDERLRTEKGFIRVSDNDGYRLEAVMVEKTITIKGEGGGGGRQERGPTVRGSS